ncbi:MAG: hypothetical protein ACRKFN_10820 [Desulfitobacterium sp.]
MEKLYFHDSQLESVSFNSERQCELTINYYNWEGNKECSGTWSWKKIRIKFGYIAVMEWNAPDLKNDCSSILEVKYDEDLDKLYELEVDTKRTYAEYQSPLFDDVRNFLSMTFYLSNFKEGLKEDFGYLKVIGSNVSTE